MRNEMSDDEFFNYIIELEDEEKIQRGEMDFQENPKPNIRYQLEDFEDNNFDNEEYDDLYKIKSNNENSLGCSSWLLGMAVLYLIYFIIVKICGE